MSSSIEAKSLINEDLIDISIDKKPAAVVRQRLLNPQAPDRVGPPEPNYISAVLTSDRVKPVMIHTQVPWSNENPDSDILSDDAGIKVKRGGSTNQMGDA